MCIREYTQWMTVWYEIIGLKLKQALDCQLLKRGIDEELTWCAEVEKQLNNEDIGKDLQSVRFLIEKHKVCIIIS